MVLVNQFLNKKALRSLRWLHFGHSSSTDPADFLVPWDPYFLDKR